MIILLKNEAIYPMNANCFLLLYLSAIIPENSFNLHSGHGGAYTANPMQSARTLSVHMYALSREGLHIDEGYATAVVLLAVVVIINTVSARIANRIGGKA